MVSLSSWRQRQEGTQHSKEDHSETSVARRKILEGVKKLSVR
jgi:hypothetical protein